MPILVRDFTWTQSESIICINLPLKGTKVTNLDVLNSSEFCKVSYPPFLFECWFRENVKDEECLAIVKNGVISLKFNKLKENIWSDLFHLDFQNKELLKKVRENAIVLVGERAEKLIRQKADDIIANKKLALQQQMKLEEDERNQITNIKENEKSRMNKEIQIFKEISQYKEHKSMKSDDMLAEKLIFDKDDMIQSVKNLSKTEIILPRSNGSINFKFTPRVFPTPSRESQDKQEKDWLQNQSDARKLGSLPEELKDLSENEANLDWLKEKANGFYKQENFQTAISVYNHAIRLFPKVATLYSNRAACHFKVKNLIKCVEDCTRALDLLSPPVAENANNRLRSHVRRGSAFCELELYPEGLLDYEAALKIDPNNKEVLEDAENIRKIIVGTPPDFDYNI